MDKKEKIKELQEIIKQELTPLITHDYVLWGLPYYSNIGDTLIWEGELEFLKSVPHKCLNTCGWDEYRVRPLPLNTVILITGGGYFGDVWRKAWGNVMNTIEHYPDNPIIILPNTIFYNNEEVIRSDAVRLSKLKKLTICVRDKVSYEIAKNNFRNDVRLVPDMAFYIKNTYLEQWRKPETDKILYLKRIDKELGETEVNLKNSKTDVRDWPTMDGKPNITERIFGKIYEYSHSPKLKRLLGNKILHQVEKFFAYNFYRQNLTRRGVEFISQYSEVYSTRLHVMILSVLLGKKVYYIDNSYGKLSSFYDTWLADCEKVEKY